MDGNLRFKILPLTLYGAALFFSVLCASYIGGYFVYIYLFFLIMPLISLVFIFISYLGLRYSQTFSTNHPKKGEALNFEFIISNETFVPSALINVVFEFFYSDESFEKEKSGRMVRPFSQEIIHKSILCLYRGVYTIGTKELKISGFFGFVTVLMPLWTRTFYVLPAIIELPGLPDFLTKGGSLLQGSLSGIAADPLLFSGLKPYRYGESAQAINWKKYASTGMTVVRENEVSAEPSVIIYFDTMKDSSVGRQRLMGEDCSVETLTALVKCLLDYSVSVRIIIQGQVFFIGNRSEDFNRFYQSTPKIYFNDENNFLQTYNSDSFKGRQSGLSLTISHRPDPEILELLDKVAGEGESFFMISVILSFSNKERLAWKRYSEIFKEKGHHLLEVKSNDTIREDLING